MWATAAVLMAAPTSVLFVASLTSSWILVSASAESNYITAEPGDTVTLPCGADRGPNTTAVQWFRRDLRQTHVFVYQDGDSGPEDQDPFPSDVELKDSQMKDGDMSVTLKNVTFNDTGTYECRVNSEDMYSASTINLYVSPDMRTITAGYGDTVTLPCQAPAGTNITAVKWTRPDLDTFRWYLRLFWFDPEYQHPSYQNRVELKDSQMKDGDVSVTLKDVTTEDTGTYLCHVSQGPAGSWISIIHLNVSAVLIHITAEPGDTVTLPCRAPSSSETRAVEWTRPDVGTALEGIRLDLFLVDSIEDLWWFDPDSQHPSFKERVELKDSQMKDGDVSVTLKDVTFNDTGTYECHVIQRSGGSWMSTIHLNVTQAAAASDRHLSVLRIILFIVVSSPYIISTFLLVSVHGQRPAGRKTPVSMTTPPSHQDDGGLDEQRDDVTTEHRF